MTSWTRAAALTAWGGAVAAAMTLPLAHDVTPGSGATDVGDWPAGTAVLRSTDRPTLVVFVHPHCPCAMTTLAALDGVAAAGPAEVLFVHPPGADPEWGAGPLWDRAGRTTACRRRIDDGREARRFGAVTSGQAFLYDPSGRLIYRGGLTSSRSQPGTGPGRDAVLAWAGGRLPAVTESPVFGCPLFDD